MNESTNFLLQDKDGSDTKVGYQSTVADEELTAGQALALDTITHAKIVGFSRVDSPTSPDALKVAATIGDYDDKTYRLNMTFKDTAGKTIKFVLPAPKAKKHPGEADYIYLQDVDGGKMVDVLPVGGTGLVGADVARKVESIRGLAVDSLTFISGSLTKSAR